MTPKDTKINSNPSYTINARTIAKMYEGKGLINTSKWLIFALENKDSPLMTDFSDITRSFKQEFRLFRSEYYYNPEFNEDCHKTVFNNTIASMACGPQKFFDLTTQLIPLIGRIIDNNKRLDNLMLNVTDLPLEEKFYRCCQYYQTLWEGDYKYVRRNLLAMKKLSEGKTVTITETLALTFDQGTVESKTLLKEVTPEILKTGEHEHLRNAIAHTNYKFIETEDKMQFWDIKPSSQKYSWGPKKFTFEQFIRCLIEVNLFCEAYGLNVLLLVALEDIAHHK